jgi:hypothetical protein
MWGELGWTGWQYSPVPTPRGDALDENVTDKSQRVRL